jgi:catechol 2,3-dioxygenase-like lactoylglutathione lyase family enzyme
MQAYAGRVQVIFAVNDVERTVRFYEDAFGWPRNDRIGFENYVELLPPDGGSVGFYERSGFAAEVGADPVAVDGEQVAPAYLYVRVDDVDSATAKLEEAGARPLSPLTSRAWGERAAWFADPDGNVVAVAQPA